MSPILENKRISLPSGPAFDKIEELFGGFNLTETQMRQIMQVMESEMSLGLSRHAADRKKSSLQMENTFVHQTMDGTEDGEYLALDLGGTNFRVIYVEMRGGQRTKTIPHYYVIPDEILVGEGVALMDFLAECVAKLIKEENISTTKVLPLGFTFSFPMVQSSLNSALLLTWTKKFKCTGVENQDVVKMLEDAFHRRGDVNVTVEAILNDTVGTLMTGAYEDHDCAVGIIMGTGSNAAYIEYLDRVDKWTGGDVKAGSQELIDIEWGAFGDNGVLDFFKLWPDTQVDKHSNHVGSFTFEKLFAGLYLGEIVRWSMVKLVEEGLMFTNTPPSEIEWLHTYQSFPTASVSKIESDAEDVTTNVETTLKDLGVTNPPADDMHIIKYLCASVSNRAAKILTSTLTVLLRHINKEKVTVAVDGSLFEHHPTIPKMMREFIDHLVPETKTKFLLVKDGSGLGAAYVAAVADRIEKQDMSNGSGP